MTAARESDEFPDLPPREWDPLERRVRAFEAAWAAGDRPALKEHLVEGDSFGGQLLVELVHAELEFRLQAGEAARVEEYLDRFPELRSQASLVVRLLETEFLSRSQSEPELVLEEFKRRFPDHIDRLIGLVAEETTAEDRLCLTEPVRLDVMEEGAKESALPSRRTGSEGRVMTDPTPDGTWEPADNLTVPIVRQEAATATQSVGGAIDETWIGTSLRPASGEGSSGRSHLAALQGKLTAPFASAGSSVGPYRLVRKLGEGGMGAVWEAVHLRLEKTVAVKLLSPWLLAHPEAVARFGREMKAAGRITHPHVVAAFDAGEADGIHYLAMEYVEGSDLHRLVQERGPLPIADATDAVRQAALGLAAAHSCGLVHRDIKPQNLLVTAAGVVKVVDLGLARLAEEAAANTSAAGLTEAGQVMGTPDYMAPEQWDDTHAVGPAADLYALGCTLYYALVGRPPFSTERHASITRKMAAHIGEPAPELAAARPDAPVALCDLYRRLMAKSPEDRPSSAAELAAELSRISMLATVQEAGLAAESEQLNSVVVPSRCDSLEEIATSVAPHTMRKPKPMNAAAGGPPRRRKLLLLGAAGGFGAVLFGVLFALTLEFGDATLRIESFDPAVKVAVSQGGKVLEVIDLKTGASATLDPGTYELKLTNAEGLAAKLSRDTVSLSRGDEEVVRVVRVAKTRPAVSANGKTDQSVRDAVLWVLESGGEVTLSIEGRVIEARTVAHVPTGQITPEAVLWVGFVDFPFDGSMIDRIRPLSLTALSLNGSKIVDADLPALRAAFPRLRSLGLYLTPVTDAGLAHLRGWETLEVLDLPSTGVTDVGMASLRGLLLQELNLAGTPVGDAGIQALDDLAGLKTLRLRATKVTDAGLRSLERSQLTWVDVSQTRVTDAGLAQLTRHPLVRLAAGNEGVTDSGAETLRKIETLRELDLTGSALTDTGLAILSGLPNLTSLRLDDTAVTAAGVAEFRASKPGCKVTWRLTGQTVPDRSVPGPEGPAGPDSATRHPGR